MLRFIATTHLAVCIGIATILFLANSNSSKELERLWYDFRVQATAAPMHESRIAIIDIDEHSLQQQGRWPWQRSKIADLLVTLNTHYEVALIGIDILFPDQTGEDLKFFQSISSLPITYAQAFQLAQYNRGYSLLGTRSLKQPCFSRIRSQ